jgi:hypothetical protein
MMNAIILAKCWLLQALFLPLPLQLLHGPAYDTFFKKFSAKLSFPCCFTTRINRQHSATKASLFSIEQPILFSGESLCAEHLQLP